MGGPEGLFEPIFISDAMAPITSARNWVQKMVEFECVLADVQGRLGLIPSEAAYEIAALTKTHGIDPTVLGVDARSSATPVIALVRSLSDQLSEAARPWVHYGATSQDVLDTATMLVAKEAIQLIFSDLVKAGVSIATIVEEHRNTPMVARTLLQHALPTTFGLKAANWLSGLVSAGSALERVYEEGLAIQFGGAGGTLAALGESGAEVGRQVARAFDLPFPEMPWHSQRVRIAELGSALSLVVGSQAKIAADIVLASQAEVGELSERQDAAGGGSSALPQKVNPVGPIVVNACFRRMQGLLPVLFGCMLAENERGAGEWPAEWETLRDLLNLTGTSANRTARTVSNLVADKGKMRYNLDLSRGNVMSERVMIGLSEKLGRTVAHDLIRQATKRSAANQTTLYEELAHEAIFRDSFGADQALEMFDPLTYLGSAHIFIGNALSSWEKAGTKWRQIALTGKQNGPGSDGTDEAEN